MFVDFCSYHPYFYMIVLHQNLSVFRGRRVKSAAREQVTEWQLARAMAAYPGLPFDPAQLLSFSEPWDASKVQMLDHMAPWLPSLR
eukprot:s4000_g4.t1